MASMCDLSDDMSSDCLLTDDIWDKFQLSGLDISQFEWNRGELDAVKCTTDIFLPGAHEYWADSARNDEKKIRNHDCMWAGHCGSKEHSVDDIKNILIKPISLMFQPMMSAASIAVNDSTAVTATPAVTKQSPIAPGRSLLLKTQPQQQQQMYLQQQMQQLQTTPENLDQIAMLSNMRYESPPNSDDEESKSQVLQYLQDYISECDLDDEDLVDYFKDFEEEQNVVEETKIKIEPKIEIVDEPIITTPPKQTTDKHFERSANIARFVNDHCYHKDKNASMRMPETPSDSEEEIDVVTTDDKHHSISQRSAYALPTNPTTRDRQQLQKTMASAITKNGIRMLVPRKNGPISVEHSPSKRRPDARGIKRNRHRMPITPYKKQRAYQAHQVSSDSEQEPSEKRIEHNNMERQRRVDLRNAFEELRVLVPEVNKRERAPKVVILREAAVYCHQLTDVSDAMKRQVEEMRRQQKRLRARLSQLRLSLAPKHR